MSGESDGAAVDEEDAVSVGDKAGLFIVMTKEVYVGEE